MTLDVAHSTYEHSRITPTARSIAYLRSFSDIPYAQSVSEALSGRLAASAIHKDDLTFFTSFCAPMIEARYKCFDAYIRDHSNVLELALGTSIERGISLCARPGLLYVGTDLPAMISELPDVLRKIKSVLPNNYYLKPANALSIDEIFSCAEHFLTGNKTIVISEGLWAYLTPDEQSICADNIRRLLAFHPGVWITPDIIDLETYENDIAQLSDHDRAGVTRVIDNVASFTGRHLSNTTFKSRDVAIQFFNKHGFQVHILPMIHDRGRIVSLALWNPQDRLSRDHMFTNQTVWILKPSSP